MRGVSEAEALARGWITTPARLSGASHPNPTGRLLSMFQDGASLDALWARVNAFGYEETLELLARADPDKLYEGMVAAHRLAGVDKSKVDALIYWALRRDMVPPVAIEVYNAMSDGERALMMARHLIERARARNP